MHLQILNLVLIIHVDGFVALINLNWKAPEKISVYSSIASNPAYPCIGNNQFPPGVSISTLWRTQTVHSSYEIFTMKKEDSGILPYYTAPSKAFVVITN